MPRQITLGGLFREEPRLREQLSAIPDQEVRRQIQSAAVEAAIEAAAAAPSELEE